MAKSLRRNALSHLFLKICNIVFPMLTQPYVTRVLSPEAYGEYSVVLTLLSFFLPFATLGIYNYGIRCLSEHRDQPEQASQVFSTLFWLGATSSLGCSIVYGIYGLGIWCLGNTNHINWWLFIILGSQLMIQVLYLEWVSEVYEDYHFILVKSLAIRVFMFILTLWLVKRADDVVNYAFILTGCNVANYLLIWCHIRRYVRVVPVSWSSMLSHLPSLVSMLMLTNSEIFYTILDRYVLGALGVPIMVANYYIAQNAATMLTGVVYSVLLVAVPRLSYYVRTKQETSYLNLVYKVVQNFYFLVVPMAMWLAFIGREVVWLYAGDKYPQAGFLLTLFALRSLVVAMEKSLVNTVLFIRAAETKVAMAYGVGAIANMILKLGLYWGKVTNPVVYLITTMTIEVMIVGWQLWYIQRHRLVEIHSFIHAYGKYVGISLSFGLVYLVVGGFITTTTLQAIAIKILTFTVGCACIYIGVAWATGDRQLSTFTTRLWKKQGNK